MKARREMRQPPMLLTMPQYSGTLAAVRTLGEAGVAVTVAGETLLAQARWSRHTTRWVTCPKAENAERFLEWLLDFGRREPGQVLYPCSDDLAWLFSAHLGELSPLFAMYQPPLDTIVGLLDKKRLAQACGSVGLDTAATWFPEAESDLERLAHDLPYPVLLKSRTQVLRRGKHTKGTLVRSRSELLPGLRRFLSHARFLPGPEKHLGDARMPMVQQFHPVASQAVYSVTGFIARTGELLASRGALKVLQRTEPVGLGVCFEAVPLDPELASGVTRLCRSVGYFGAFEVELLRHGERNLVIDFNPRFYGQMGFDLRRGMPLAYFAWLAALGHDSELRARAQASQVDGPGTIFCHRVVFELLLAARTMTGQMPACDLLRWRRWYADNRAGAVDASADRTDWLPGLVHAATEVVAGTRALPRVLLGS